MKKLKVLGVSAGAGILLFPFRKNLIANIETRGVFYTKGLEQWKLNFGGISYYKNETFPDCKSRLWSIFYYEAFKSKRIGQSPRE